jgi:predicted DNA-binding transcriptional regulator AlpA
MTNNPDTLADAVAARVLAALVNGKFFVAPEYLTAQQVAHLTGLSTKALEKYRAKRIGPPFLKIGHNVRYRAEDVRAWMEGAK